MGSRESIAALVLALATSGVSADEVSDAAAAVARAHRGGDDAVLAELARRDDVDPWLLVDELVQRGEPDAARAYMEHLGRQVPLAAYLASDAAKPVPSRDRERLREARKERLANRPACTREILRSLAPREGTVFCVLARHEKAMALRDLGWQGCSERAYTEAARAAHAIGWRTRRNHLLRYARYRGGLTGGPFWPDSACLTEATRFCDPSRAIVIYCNIQGEAVAITVTSERTDFVPLGSWFRLQRACTTVRDLLPVPPADPAPAREILLEPLGFPDTVTRLLIMPQQELSDVPFSFLIDQCETACVPESGTWHRVDLPEAENGKGVLVVYDTRSSDAETAERRREAEAVGTVLLSGSEATSHKFFEVEGGRERWRAIHFACPFVKKARSLLLASGPDENGQLPVELLIPRRLHADLIVFSNSFTGSLRPMTIPLFGEVQFVTDTAPRALVHLWVLDPVAACAFMTRFYELWNPAEGTGLPAATAVRKAQAFVRSKPEWEHPYYWAGWQLWVFPG